MNKLLKSVRPATNKKDEIIKKSITTQLSNSVKEIQYAGLEESRGNRVVDITEAANQLCVIIEAIFLHGLKDSLTHRFRMAIADVDERPEPSFWPPLLIISHRQIIDQITSLSQITSEVGQCRAWIRLALNDCLLSSYLLTLRQDSSSLKSFYKPGAYVRDSELLDVAQRLIEGVETFKTFTLPCNSSILNTWPLPSLFLSGIWSPTLKTCPVAPCDDVAQSLEENTNTHSIGEANSDTASLSSAMSFSSQTSGLRQIVALTEDEVLKIILAKDKDKYVTTNYSSCDDLKSTCSSEPESKSVEDNVNYTVGNSLNRRTGWSFDENQEEGVTENEHDKKNDNYDEPKPVEASFNALIESYNMLSGGYIRTPDFRGVWQKFEDERVDKVNSGNITNDEQNGTSPITSLQLIQTESRSLAAQIGKIAREKGFDVQNYECAGCKNSLGIEQKPNVCAFTAEYFCDSCMSPEKIGIPARIIHNWDFKLYHVSQKSYDYINEIKDHPVIDFKVLNTYIYGAVEEMAELQTLRNQLNFLRAYLYTCREPVIEQLQKQMWPREYMYEHIHQYSIKDLLEIPNNVLAQYLKKVVAFGKDHVAGCWLCSQKGFVCEVCNKPKALFPFDVENVFRCENCNAVYHKNCLNSSRPCPKCKRRKEREGLPLLGAV